MQEVQGGLDIATPCLNPLRPMLTPEEMESRVIRNPEGQIISFNHAPVNEAVQAVRGAQYSTGKGIWEHGQG